MTCNPLIDQNGKVRGFVCGPGAYSYLVMAQCPWCCLGEDQTIHGFREVHGGYCAPDMICGSCGQYWSHDDDRPLRGTDEDLRDENLAKVEALRAAGKTVGPYPIPAALLEDNA